jgi:hypothetical protein
MQQLQTTLMKGELDPKLLRKIHKKTSKAVTIQSHSFEPQILSLASLAKPMFDENLEEKVKVEDYSSA